MNVKSFSMWILLISLLCVVLLAGCSQESGGSNESTKITLSTLSGEVTENLQAAADKFMEENPEVEIEIVDYPEDQYKEQGRNYFTSNDRPDLAWYWVEDNFFQMAEAGVFEPLNDLYERENYYDVLPKSTIDLYTSSDGNQYAINTDVVWTPVLYYNKDIFEEVGVEPPTTFEELHKIGEKLSEAGYIPLAAGAGEGYVTGHMFSALLARLVPPEIHSELLDIQNNGSKFDFTDPSLVAVWEELENIRNYLLSDGAVGVSDDETRGLFVQGKAAMYSQGSWAAGDGNLGKELDDDFNLGFFFYPQIDPQIDPTVGLGVGNSLMILKGTEHKEIAEEFIAHVMSKESQIKTATTIGFFPSRTDISVDELEGVSEDLLEQYNLMQELGTSSLFGDVIPARLQTSLFELNQKVLSNTITPTEAAEEFEAIKNEIIEN